MSPVSVVIPLFNKGRYIARAMRSVLDQTCRDFELIIVNDGSTDDGADIVAAFSDPRVRVLHQENSGESAARNRGISEARCGMIAFLDADDEWDSPFLEAIAGLAERFPAAGLLATGYRRLYSSGFTGDVTVELPDRKKDSFVLNGYFRLARRAAIISASSVAIPKRIFDDLGGFLVGEPHGADGEMWGRIALRYPVAYDRRVLATYHCEAQGRACLRTPHSPRPHPFGLTGRRALQSGGISGSDERDISRYINACALARVSSLIRAGERRSAAKLLSEEVLPRERPALAAWYALALRALPMSWLRAVDRIRLSRATARFSQRLRRNVGVLVRISRRREDCAGPEAGSEGDVRPRWPRERPEP